MVMRLRTLLGDHPGTSALKKGAIKSDLVEFDFVDYSPTNKGFKPMVREQAFDVAEKQLTGGTITLITLLQAEQTLFTAQNTLVQVRLNKLLAASSLFQALGGGWTPAGTLVAVE